MKRLVYAINTNNVNKLKAVAHKRQPEVKDWAELVVNQGDTPLVFPKEYYKDRAFQNMIAKYKTGVYRTPRRFIKGLRVVISCNKYAIVVINDK